MTETALNLNDGTFAIVGAADQLQAAYAAGLAAKDKHLLEAYAEGLEAGRKAPNGWKLVPKVPNEDMTLAGVEESVLGRPSIDDGTYVSGIYHLMLAAAPEYKP